MIKFKFGRTEYTVSDEAFNLDLIAFPNGKIYKVSEWSYGAGKEAPVPVKFQNAGFTLMEFAERVSQKIVDGVPRAKKIEGGKW